MSSRSIQLTAAFVGFLWIVMLASPGGHLFAQEEPQPMDAFQKMSLLEQKAFLSNLDREQKKTLFEGLGDAEIELIYDSLTDEDKALLDKMGPDEGERQMDRPAPAKAAPAPPAEAPRTPVSSPMENILSGQFPTDITRQLTQYGYDFFAEDGAVYAPITDVPVGADYIIGPGDNFKIHLWGKAENTYTVTVDRDGIITLPRLGAVGVNGMTLAEMKRYLAHKFKAYYPQFEMNISMGRLRTIQVFVVGEARKPGTYAVHSLSTVITALFATGGPNKNGSMRGVQLIRNGQRLKTIDLYDFFLSGDKSQDERLQPGDTLFIPVIGPVVGVAGNVRRPAIYEIRSRETIGDMLILAGGVLPVGSLQNVVVERVEAHRRRIVKSFNIDPRLPSDQNELSSPLADGDLIKIYPVHERIRNVVYLEGHVKYPREYELKAEMRLSDLIPSYDHLLPEPYLPQAEIMRFVPPDLHPEVIEFDLGRMLAGDRRHDLKLQDLDRVIVYHQWDKAPQPRVFIRGEVRQAGEYRLYQDMTVKDLIFEAGNPTEKAFMEQATLVRLVSSPAGSDTVEMPFSPSRAMAGLVPDNMRLDPNDVVYIREIPKFSQARTLKIHLEGEFVFPGEYAFSEGERLGRIIERAGGLTGEAYPLGAVFQRETVRIKQLEQIRGYISKLEETVLTLTAQATETALDEDQAAILQQTLASQKELLKKLRSAQPTGRMVIDLVDVIHRPSSDHNFALRAGDRLIVPKRPDFVSVIGEVYNPIALFAEKDRTLGYYLEQVGGTTEEANEKQMYLVRANGKVISKAQTGYGGMATWDPKEYRWTLHQFYQHKIDPGDTIIVPKKVEKYPWLRLTKDITQIAYQIAVSAGVLIAAY